MAYTHLWEYQVRSDLDATFRRAYGPDGAWVTLFRQASGYLSTQLYRDRDDPHRYLTVDTWESAQAYEEFRRRFGAAFTALDASCEALTLREAAFGRFDLLTGDDTQ